MRADADPVAAAPLIADLAPVASASGSRRESRTRHHEAQWRPVRRAICAPCIELPTAVLDDGSADAVADFRQSTAGAALLARDEQALAAPPSTSASPCNARTRVAPLVDDASTGWTCSTAQPSTVDPRLAAASTAGR